MSFLYYAVVEFRQDAKNANTVFNEITKFLDDEQQEEADLDVELDLEDDKLDKNNNEMVIHKPTNVVRLRQRFDRAAENVLAEFNHFSEIL